MRLLHTADWHLGRTLEGRDRLSEQEQFLEELCGIVEDQKVDVVLMAGDVFDTVNPPAAAEQLFYESMAKLTKNQKCKVIIIAGNHDNPDRLSASGPLAALHGISILGYPTIQPISFGIESTGERLKLAGLPYPSESRLKEILTESFDEEALRNAYDIRIEKLFEELCCNFDASSVNIAMSHIYVAGGRESESERPIQVGGAYTVSANALPSKAQYIALGHLHRPQSIHRTSSLARYSGSPLCYSFSEAGQSKSVTILDIAPGSEPNMEELHLSCGKPLVRWKAEDGLAQVHRWLDEKKDTNAWIDLEVHLKDTLSMEQIHHLRNAHKGFIHIRPVFEEMNGMDRDKRTSDLPIDELFKRFYERQTNGGTPDEATVTLFMELIHENEGGV
ncbi:exonuclease SbcCD subunit D [Pseudalkalibacillus salsuginis]|uniref:exonuclease SbcCD subunit D n=1 Tax=Pseudalkalibacillus salsuginis TaxID=2910972 RepID=UPI001F1E7AF2|nr:exonuclease SbcCD subunit D [Pseudalkalibacillus salsuginis]MCF6409274.1 exonuclease SbcCD subunit D [Pseudalkalibacillus salsuginis]